MCLGFIDHDKKIMTSLQEYIIWRPDIDDDDAIIMTDFKKILYLVCTTAVKEDAKIMISVHEYIIWFIWFLISKVINSWSGFFSRIYSQEETLPVLQMSRLIFENITSGVHDFHTGGAKIRNSLPEYVIWYWRWGNNHEIYILQYIDEWIMRKY